MVLSIRMPLVEEIRGKIRELGIKPAFLRRLGPSVTKEELESVHKKIESLTRIFEEMSLFFVFSRKNETSRPPPAPTSDSYDKPPCANGPTHPPDHPLIPPARSLRPARTPARNPRARRHHTRGGRERGVVSGDLSCGASGGVRARCAIGGARMRRERDMVGARHRKDARLGQGAEPRGTTDRTSTHTHATPRARSLLHAGAVAVEAATDDARDHARLPTRAEITRECGGVHVTSAQRSADPALV